MFFFPPSLGSLTRAQILPTHLHSAIDSVPQDPLPSLPAGDLKASTLQQPSGMSRSELPSPIHSQRRATVDGFDDMSHRAMDSTYTLQPPPRHSSSWTAPPLCPEMLSPYAPQQRVAYSAQPMTASSRVSSSLPSIRDIDQRLDRVNGYESSGPPTTASQSQLYGHPPNNSAQDVGPFTAERPAYYDPTQRYSQGYSQTARSYPPPQPEYPRYVQSSYDLYRTNNTQYHSPYGAVPYSPSSVGVYPPPTPGGVMDTDGRGRRRRGNLPKPVTDILRAWFHEHLDHPYPTEEDKQVFIARTGLTINQVCRGLSEKKIPADQIVPRSVTGLSTPEGGSCLRCGMHEIEACKALLQTMGVINASDNSRSALLSDDATVLHSFQCLSNSSSLCVRGTTRRAMSLSPSSQPGRLRIVAFEVGICIICLIESDQNLVRTGTKRETRNNRKRETAETTL